MQNRDGGERCFVCCLFPSSPHPPSPGEKGAQRLPNHNSFLYFSVRNKTKTQTSPLSSVRTYQYSLTINNGITGEERGLGGEVKTNNNHPVRTQYFTYTPPPLLVITPLHPLSFTTQARAFSCPARRGKKKEDVVQRMKEICNAPTKKDVGTSIDAAFPRLVRLQADSHAVIQRSVLSHNTGF